MLLQPNLDMLYGLQDWRPLWVVLRGRYLYFFRDRNLFVNNVSIIIILYGFVEIYLLLLVQFCWKTLIHRLCLQLVGEIPLDASVDFKMSKKDSHSFSLVQKINKAEKKEQKFKVSWMIDCVSQQHSIICPQNDKDQHQKRCLTAFPWLWSSLCDTKFLK